MLWNLVNPGYGPIALNKGVGVPPLSAYSTGNPLFIAHRGDALIGPENTIEAFDAALASGAKALEFDVRLLSDGALGVMHDATVDRTTTATGNVVDLDAAGFEALNIDALSWHGSYSDTLHPPLFPAVVSRYKGRAILMPEIKVSGAKQGVVDALTAAGIPATHALVSADSLANLDVVVSAGYPAMYLAVGTSQIATAQSAGVTWVALASTEADATFAAWHAAGVKVIVYTVTRRWRLAELKALGTITGFITDDHAYLSRTTPIRTTDYFAAQTWQPGMLSGANDYALTEAARGRFFSPDQFGWNEQANTAFTLLGDLSPVKSDPLSRSFEISFKAKYVSASASTQWWAIWLAETDKVYANAGIASESGYLVMARKSGILQIYKVVAGAATSLVSQAGTLIADGSEVDFKITVAASTITLARLNGDGSVNYSATTTGEVGSPIGCGYMQLGRASVNARIRALAVA